MFVDWRGQERHIASGNRAPTAGSGQCWGGAAGSEPLVEFDHEKTDARQPVCIFKDLALRALDVDLGKIECRNSMLAHQRSDGDRANIGGSGCLVGDESPGAIGSRSRVRRRNLNPSILVPEGRANRYDMGPGRHVSLQQFEVVGLGFDCKDGRIGISAGKENRSQPNVGSGIEDESRRERQVDIVLTTVKISRNTATSVLRVRRWTGWAIPAGIEDTSRGNPKSRKVKIAATPRRPHRR